MELKNLKAASLSTLGRGIKDAFDLFNLHRLHTGIDHYGQVCVCVCVCVFVCECVCTCVAYLVTRSLCIPFNSYALSHTMHSHCHVQGRNPFYLEPAVVIALTDGGKLISPGNIETEVWWCTSCVEAS